MSEDKVVLEFEHVSGNTRKFYNLSDVSFSLPTGYIAGLAGENGAGKTTLFEYIMQPQKLYKGNIYLQGREIHEDYLWSRQKIGFVSESNRFFMNMSAMENGKLAATLFDEWDQAAFGKALQRMGVPMSRRLSKLSRGEYLKFQTAYAMAHHPVLYLLDEVTAGMDPVFRVDYFKILADLLEEENISVLMISHIEEEMERKMDYMGIMSEGKLISWGENL